MFNQLAPLVNGPNLMNSELGTQNSKLGTRNSKLYFAMPIVKKRNQQTETRLLLESGEPVELPPAEIDDKSVLVQFEAFKPYTYELLAALRAGTIAEPVPVMLDGSTFAIHGETRTFWVKLWHAAGTDMIKIDRAQVISCIPSTRGLQVTIPNEAEE